METLTIYQTLEFRNNRMKVELDGPFKCDWENTWLGDGYYFWDGIKDVAHWWGRSRYKKKGKEYIICKAQCDFDSELCFDLHGNTDHINQFRDIVLFMKKQGKFKKDTTVKRVLEHMKKTKVLTHPSIRVCGVNSISKKYRDYNLKLKFEYQENEDGSEIIDYRYLDLFPAIQICIFDKDILNVNDFHQVYSSADQNNKFNLTSI